MVNPATLRDERGVLESRSLGSWVGHRGEVKGRCDCGWMKSTYRVVNVKALQCAGLVVTPKLSVMSVYDESIQEAALKPHLRKATKNVATEAYW